jgi:hypothetical protein
MTNNRISYDLGYKKKNKIERAVVSTNCVCVNSFKAELAEYDKLWK